MDTIYREQAIAAINSRKSYIKPSGPYDEYSEGRYDAYEAAIEELEELPPAEKTGKWLIPQRRGVMTWNEKAYAECSVCHEVIFNARSMKFCPQCGTRMVNDENL